MEHTIYVVAAVIVRDGKILCVQRGSGELAYKWEFPGGKIEAGKSLIQALKREIMEELSCTIKVNSQVTETLHKYSFGNVHLTTFYCELIKGKLILNEHITKRWLLPEQLLSLDWAEADIPTVHQLMSVKNGDLFDSMGINDCMR